VWWSYCLDTAGAPALWPWMQTARHLIERDAAVADSFRDLLPELAGEHAPTTTPVDLAGVRFRLFEALTRHLESSATGERLTLVLEDIHWADPATLELLGFLVESRLRARLHIIVTRRVDESPDDALRDLLGRLARSSSVDRTLLTGLRPADIVEFTRVIGGRDVSEDEAAALHAKTAGNPFFLAELTRLFDEHSGTASSGATPAIPDGVRDVVVRRLDATDSELTSLLRVAAVAGERFHPDVVAQAAGLDVDTASRLYESGELTHWLAPSQPGRRELRFAHALVRDVVLAEQTVAQRERSHWSIGTALRDLYGDSDGAHLSEIAGHLAAGVGAGSLMDAVDMAARAATSATRRQAHDEAVTNWSLAESLLEARPSERERSMRVRLSLGESLRLAGDWAAARQAFSRALSDAEILGQPSMIAEAAVSFRTMWLWTWREHGVTDQRMVAALRSCLAGVEGDRRMEALVLGTLGVELFYVDRDEGLRLGEMAVEIAEAMADDALLLDTLRALHLTLKSAEHLDRRIAVADRLVELATRLGNPDHEAHARVDRSFLLLQTCHPDAWTEHQRARAMTEALREPMKIAHVQQHAAVWAYLRGDVAEAERLADQANQVHGRSGFWNTKAVHEIAQVQYQQQRGTLREHLRNHPAVSPNGSSPITQPVIEIAWAYAAHLVGDDQEAMRRLTPPPQPRRGSSWLAMKYMHAVAGSAIGAPGLRELYDEIEPFAGRLAIGSEGPAVFGVMDHALGVLAARLGDRDAARRWLERAVELHDQLGGGPPATDSRRALAALSDESTI
jgi:tetratricopeptide (TPR) repeat protein